MFKIFNNREHFFQWDLNQKLIVNDKTIKEVHYCNRTGDCSLPVECYELNGLWVADVPNELLQQAFILRVWAVCEDYTKIEERFKVVAKTKPTDYVYTPTEVKRYDDLEQKIEEALSGDSIESAVTEYLKENPVTGGATAEQVEQIEQNKVAIQELAKELEELDIPEVKLDDYALKSELPDLSEYALKSEIPEEPNLEAYALKSEVPDVSGFALKTDIPTVPDTSSFITMTQVEQKGYQTEAQVNSLINSALGVIENGTY